MRPLLLARLVGLALLVLHSPAEDCDVAIEVNEDTVFNHHCSTGDRACVTSRVREAMLAFDPGCASRMPSAGDAANRGTSEGCWLVYQPNMAYDGGGTRVMHQLTGELISQGACVRMAYVHPALWHIVALTREAAQSVNATEDEVERWLHRGIGALDTIVVPETAHLFAPIDASAASPNCSPTRSATSPAAPRPSSISGALCCRVAKAHARTASSSGRRWSRRSRPMAA